ncbi:3-oxoadipate enol-lactonase [Adhaeribacter sp. BT258]|uniref:3-oxoadipate enol-lactonase n=1 Tax=Adhaeribacter terrigena TaxID=2793070 RepID=A0ABS1C070_9BACT|nr:3-oxoadipate enol-lactonase [Adhaeribacter terrigena]MBK0402799.1 3-oxoadipate enol-lactonase [Adhaeribacter terrigena]
MPIIRLSSHNCFYLYEDFGKPETIVFSNSLGTNLTMWDAVVEMVKAEFNVLRYDTRGHGQSSINSATVSIPELGQDVLELLDHLKLEKVYFCGLSMGGLIGQWLGIYAPKRFKKIILTNTAAKIGTDETWNTRIDLVKTNGLSVLQKGTADRWFTPAFREKNPEVVAEILEKFKQNSIQGYTANCAAVRDADFREELHNLKVPTLIISGLQDEVTKVADGNFMQEKIPDSSHVQLDANHLSAVELPKAFARVILEFKDSYKQFLSGKV